ncbi:MAG: DUF1292 domain-containing protein [Clostridia bacterium]|nr:DUF1292 domain-containing protein [Clostridia bacterium]
MKNEESLIMENESGEYVMITDEKGKEHPFEVVLRVPFEEKEYAIMHPLDKYPGLDEDSCAIFELVQAPGSDTATLIPEMDDDILDSVYALYVEWATDMERREAAKAAGCSGHCAGCTGCDGVSEDEE